MVNYLLEILHEIKKVLCFSPILCHFDPERKIVVETDASNLVVVRVLS
jgi:hypothetical protein